MKKYVLKISKNNKTLFDPQGNTIFSHRSWSELSPYLQKLPQLTVNIVGFLHYQQLLIPVVDTLELNELLGWKILTNFPRYRNGYCYAFDSVKNSNSERITFRFLRYRYLRALEVRLKRYRISDLNVHIDDLSIHRTPVVADKKTLFYLAILLFLLIFMGINGYRWFSLKQNIDSPQIRLESPKLQPEVAVEPLPTLGQLGFPSVPLNQAVSRNRDCFRTATDRIFTFVMQQLPSGSWVERISYDYSDHKIRFVLRSSNELAVTLSMMMTQVGAAADNRYSGEYDAQ